MRRELENISSVLIILGILLGVMCLSLVLLCWRFPPEFTAFMGHGAVTIPFFAARLGVPVPPALQPNVLMIGFATVWLSMNGIWLLSLHANTENKSLQSTHHSTVKFILGISVLLNLVFVFGMPTVLSTDTFSYLAYGRMVAFHDLNPYFHVPTQMGHDPTLAFHRWDIVMPYGPIWAFLAVGVAYLSGPSEIFTGILIFKMLAGISHLAVALLAYHVARTWSERLALVVLSFIAWNPIFLLEGAGNGHNDLLMMALALAGLLAYAHKKPWVGYLLLLASVLVKFVTLLLLALYLLVWLRQQLTWRARWGLVVKVGMVNLLFVMVSYAPFWQGAETLTGSIVERSSHALLGFQTVSEILLENVGRSLSLPAGQIEQWEFWLATLLPKVIFLVILLTQLYRLCFRPRSLPILDIMAAWNVLILSYILFINTSVFPWYFIWPLSTAIVHYRTGLQRWGIRVDQLLAIGIVLLYIIPVP